MVGVTKENFYNTCLDLGIELGINNNKKDIWIGFSGGIDSTALLQLSCLAFNQNPNYNLHAVHINHNINKNADLWQEHCSKICDSLNIDFKVIHVKATCEQLKELGSLEAALRMLRIEVWQKLLSSKDVLLLGHHLNDQVETIFLRLLRGSGLTGLGGIKPVSFLGKIRVIRPLLAYERWQLEQFVNNSKLSYIVDDSNNDLNFVRNFLRHKIFPKLIDNWPKFINNVARGANHLQKASLFIKNQAKQALLDCYINNCKNVLLPLTSALIVSGQSQDSNAGSVDSSVTTSPLNDGIKDYNILSISKLLKYDNFLQSEILREFIINQGFYPPSEAKLNKIYTEIIKAKVDRQPKLNFRQYIICRYRDGLYIYHKDYFKQKKLSFITTIDHLEIYVGNAIKKVGLSSAKKIFQKFGIPPWQRLDYPLVFHHSKLIAIIGLWGKYL